jgi:hypothetical protein
MNLKLIIFKPLRFWPDSRRFVRPVTGRDLPQNLAAAVPAYPILINPEA